MNGSFNPCMINPRSPHTPNWEVDEFGGYRCAFPLRTWKIVEVLRDCCSDPATPGALAKWHELATAIRQESDRVPRWPHCEWIFTCESGRYIYDDPPQWDKFLWMPPEKLFEIADRFEWNKHKPACRILRDRPSTRLSQPPFNEIEIERESGY